MSCLLFYALSPTKDFHLFCLLNKFYCSLVDLLWNHTRSTQKKMPKKRSAVKNINKWIILLTKTRVSLNSLDLACSFYLIFHLPYIVAFIQNFTFPFMCTHSLTPVFCMVPQQYSNLMWAWKLTDNYKISLICDIE